MGPPAGHTQTTILNPYVLAYTWPWGHLAPHLQHRFVDRSLYAPYARGAYNGYLLNPPAPVYNQWRPVEVESCARYFRESWWQNEFGRFGHQALKIVPPPTALTVLPTPDVYLMGTELLRELGEADYEYITQEAYPLL